jgi:hypothetical protein
MKRIISITLVASSLFVTLDVFAIEKLRFIGDQNILTGEKFKETEIGGLSGLVFDKKKNKIIAISDDRSSINDARFYEFNLLLDEKTFSVTPSEVITLKNKAGKAFPKGTIDFEDVILINDDLVITTEGAINKEPPINPEVFVFDREGKFKSNIEVPEKFKPTTGKENKKGVRDNLAFEGITNTFDDSVFWVGTEEALVQDDQISDPKYASTIRLIQYKDQLPVKEVAYMLDKVPSITVAGLTVGITGFSALRAIDNSTFYSLERSYNPLSKTHTIRIFKFKTSDKTTDISKMESIKEKNVTTVEKELVASLQDFTSQMSATFQNLDNIEGMTFGPKLANGHDTLIMVSDNNFSKKQRTQFLAFEIIP